MSKTKRRIYCKFCDFFCYTPEDFVSHIERKHDELIPTDMTPWQFSYYLRFNKTHGNCIICKNKTDWNEKTHKYNRFCNNPKCKEKYREVFKNRMIGKYGKTTLLNDPEQQKKMLANRSISGEYTWRDHISQSRYTGSYERSFLEFLDQVMQYDPKDVMSPSPHTYYYEYEGKTHFYIPDIFIPSLNLEIEIKDGGDNPNQHQKIQSVDKVKEKLKDEVMRKNTFNYLKIVNKENTKFLDYLEKAKENAFDSKEEQIYMIESINVIYNYSNEYYTENMNENINTPLKKVTFDDIEKFNKELNSWDYGILINGKKFTKSDKNKIDWSKYKTIPLQTMEKFHVGVCWDFVNYQHDWFKKNKIKDESYLFVLQLSDNPDDIITHTFSIITFEGKKYWFESSWFGHQHIKEVKTYKDVISELIDKYDKSKKKPYSVFSYRPEGMTGLTNSQFFDRATRQLVFDFKGSTKTESSIYDSFDDVMSYLMESDDKSKLDKRHKNDDKFKLSDYKKDIKKYDNKEGKPIEISYKDGNILVAKAYLDTEPASDGYLWFGSFMVNDEYRGHDLGNQFLSELINKYKVGALAVAKDNEIAIKLYKKFGFKIGPNNNRDDGYYYMYLIKNKVTTESTDNEVDLMINTLKEFVYESNNELEKFDTSFINKDSDTNIHDFKLF